MVKAGQMSSVRNGDDSSPLNPTQATLDELTTAVNATAIADKPGVLNVGHHAISKPWESRWELYRWRRRSQFRQWSSTIRTIRWRRHPSAIRKRIRMVAADAKFEPTYRHQFRPWALLVPGRLILVQRNGG